MQRALLLLMLLAAGCLGEEEAPLDRTGTVYRETLTFVSPNHERDATFPVQRGPTRVHVLVEGVNAADEGADVRVTLLDPQDQPSGECTCGRGETSATFSSSARSDGADGRWTLLFEPSGATRIRVTVTTS